jgi:hypothetical protein
MQPTRYVARVAPVSLVALLLAGSTGCAFLPWPQARRSGGVAALRDGRLDLRGSVHVHTTASHDAAGSIRELVRGAREAGVAWVALSEHTRPGGAPAAGRVDGVLLIPGFELRAWGGSLLALGVDTLPESYRDPVAATQEIHAAGGVAFAAHLDTSQLGVDEWVAASPDGLEIANLHSAAVESGILRLALAGALLPGPWALRLLLRTPREPLERWERLSDADAIVGGVDAHAKFRLLGWLGTADSYGRIFRLLTTHVIVSEASRDAILDALRHGRSYVAFEGRAPVNHFRFELDAERIEIQSPRDARLALVCDGVRVELGTAIEARLRTPPGALRCRAEAWLGDDLWIVTSYRRVESDATRALAATTAANAARSVLPPPR